MFARNGLSYFLSGVRLELDMRVSGKNLDEDKSKMTDYTAIALLEALSGA